MHAVSHENLLWLNLMLYDNPETFLSLFFLLTIHLQALAQQEQQTDECIAHRGELQSMDGTILSMLRLICCMPTLSQCVIITAMRVQHQVAFNHTL